MAKSQVKQVSFVLDFQDPDDVAKRVSDVMNHVAKISELAEKKLGAIQVSNQTLKSLHNLIQIIEEVNLKILLMIRNLTQDKDVAIQVRLDEASLKSASKLFADQMGASLQKSLSAAISKVFKEARSEARRAMSSVGSGGSGGGGRPPSGPFGGGGGAGGGGGGSFSRGQGFDIYLDRIGTKSDAVFERVSDQFREFGTVVEFVTKNSEKRVDSMYSKIVSASDAAKTEQVAAFSSTQTEFARSLNKSTRQAQQAYGEIVIELTKLQRVAREEGSITIPIEISAANSKADLQALKDRLLPHFSQVMSEIDSVDFDKTTESGRKALDMLRMLGRALDDISKVQKGELAAADVVNIFSAEEIDQSIRKYRDYLAVLEETNEATKEEIRLNNMAAKSRGRAEEIGARFDDLRAKVQKLKSAIGEGGVSLLDENERFQLSQTSDEFNKLTLRITMAVKQNQVFADALKKTIAANREKLETSTTLSKEERAQIELRNQELGKELTMVQAQIESYSKQAVSVRRLNAFLRGNADALQEMDRAQTELIKSIVRSTIALDGQIAGLERAAHGVDQIRQVTRSDLAIEIQTDVARKNLRALENQASQLVDMLAQIAANRDRSIAFLDRQFRSFQGPFEGLQNDPTQRNQIYATERASLEQTAGQERDQVLEDLKRVQKALRSTGAESNRTFLSMRSDVENIIKPLDRLEQDTIVLGALFGAIDSGGSLDEQARQLGRVESRTNSLIDGARKAVEELRALQNAGATLKQEEIDLIAQTDELVQALSALKESSVARKEFVELNQVIANSQQEMSDLAAMLSRLREGGDLFESLSSERTLQNLKKLSTRGNNLSLKLQELQLRAQEAGLDLKDFGLDTVRVEQQLEKLQKSVDGTVDAIKKTSNLEDASRRFLDASNEIRRLNGEFARGELSISDYSNLLSVYSSEALSSSRATIKNVAELERLNRSGVELTETQRKLMESEREASRGRTRSAREFQNQSKQVTKFQNDLDKLEVSLRMLDRMGSTSKDLTERFMGGERSSTAITGFVEALKTVDSESKRVDKAIELMGLSIANTFEAGSEEARRFQKRLDEIAARRASGAGGGSPDPYGMDIGNRGMTAGVVADRLGDAPKKVAQLREALLQTKTVLRESGPELARFGQNADLAADELSKVSTEIRKNGREAQKLIRFFDALENEGIQLTDSQKRMRAQLAALSQGFSQAGREARKYDDLIDAVKNSQETYGKSLGRSIIQNMRFIEAITLVSTVAFAVRSAFMQLVEDSRSLARSFTVLRSKTMSLVDAQQASSKAIRETAIAFGETVQSTAEVVKQLGSAGFTLEESLAALLPTMRLVVGTAADAESTARVVAGIYRVFGQELRSAGGEMMAFSKIADVLTTVYQNHQAELEEINQGLRFSAAAAKAVGVSFSDTSAFLAVLNDNMIKSGAAGRGLQVVFSQIAAKADKLESAFGVKIDKDSPFGGDAFLAMLKQINEQYRSGALSVRDLDQAFKIFGLRGARSFITLVKQAEDVEVAMQRLRHESTNAAEEVSRVVTDSLAKEFEQAKQGLLELARSFVESFRPLIILITDVVSILRSIDEALGPIGSALKFILTYGIAFVLFVETFAALGHVLVAVTNNSRALIAKMHAKAAATEAYRKVVQKLTADELALRGVQNGGSAQSAAKGAAAGTAGQASKKAAETAGGAVGGAVLSAGAKLGAAVAVLAGVVYVISLFVKSSRELKQTYAGVVGEISELNRGLRDIEKFEQRMDNIAEKLETTGKATADIGQNVVDAYSEVGSNLVSNSLVVTKTNREIAESFEEIRKSALEAAAAKRVYLEQEREKKYQELQAASMDVLQNTAGIQTGQGFSSPFDLSLEDRIRLLEEAKKSTSDLIALQIKSSGAAVGVGTDVGERVAFFGKSQLEQEKRAFDKLVNELTVKYSEMYSVLGEESAKRFLDQFLKSVADSSRGGQQAADYLRKAFEASQSRSIASSLFNVEQAKDFQKTVAPIVSKIFEGTPGTFGERFFPLLDELEKARDEALLVEENLKKVATVAAEIRSGKEGEEALSGLGSIEFTSVSPDQLSDQLVSTTYQTSFARSIGEVLTAFKDDPKQIEGVSNALQQTIEKAAKRAGTDPSHLKRLKAAMAYRFSQAAEDGELDSNEIFRLANYTAEKLADSDRYLESGVRKISVSATTVRDLIEQISAASKDFGQDISFGSLFSKFTSNEVAQQFEITKDALEEIIKLTRDASASRVTLNDVALAQNEISRLREAERLAELNEADIESAREQLMLDTALLLSARRRGDLEDEDLRKLQDNIDKNTKILDIVDNRRKQELQLNALITSRRVAIQRQTLASRQAANAYIGASVKQAEAVDKARQNFNLLFEDLRASQTLYGKSLRSSLEGIKQMFDAFEELKTAHQEYVEAFSGEIATRFEIIAQIDEMLDRDNKRAGMQAKIGAVLERVRRLNEKIVLVQDDSTRSVSERTELYRRLVDEFGKLLDLQEKQKKKEKEIKDITDDRLELLRAIRDELEGNVSEIDKALGDVFDRKLELDPSFIYEIGATLNKSASFVRSNLDDAKKAYLELLKTGQISSASLGSDTTGVVEDTTRMLLEQEKVRKRIQETQNRTLQTSEASFFEALEIGKLDKAEKFLSSYKEAIQEAAGEDSMRANELRLRAIEMQEELLASYQGAKAIYEIELKAAGFDSLDLALLAVRDRLAEIRAELAGINRLGEQSPDTVTGIISGDASIGAETFTESGLAARVATESTKQLKEVAKQFEALVGEMRGSLGKNGKVQTELLDLISTLRGEISEKGLFSKATGFNTGGRIPGFGGGDIVPAMLEPGEYVIPKNVVKKMGTGFFDRLRAGDVPGFNFGGVVGGVIGGSIFQRGLASAGRSSGTGPGKTFVRMAEALDLLAELERKTPGEIANHLSKAENAEDLKLLQKMAEGTEDQRKIAHSILRRLGSKDVDTLIEGLEKDGLTGDEKKFLDVLRQSTKDLKEFEERREIASSGRQIISGSNILQGLEKGLQEGVVAMFSGGFEDLIGNMDFGFIEQNADAFERFVEQLRNLEAAFDSSVQSAQSALRSNASDYFSYIDSIEAAEQARIQSRIDAEKQYRESLKETSEVFAELLEKNTRGVLDRTTQTLSGAITAINTRLFGTFEDNFAQVVGSIRDMGGEIFEAIKGMEGFKAIFGADGQGGLLRDVAGEFMSGIEDAGIGEKIAEHFGNALSNQDLKISDSLTSAFGPEILSKISTLGGSALSGILGMAGGGLTTVVTAVIPIVTKALGSLISLTAEPDGGDAKIKFIEKFFDELPRAAEEFSGKLIENTGRILDAFSKGAPVLIAELAERTPEFLQALVDNLREALPPVINTLQEKLPDLLAGLIPAMVDFLDLGADLWTNLIQAVGAALPTIIAELVKAIPRIVSILIRVQFVALTRLIVGLIQGIFALIERVFPKVGGKLSDKVGGGLDSAVDKANERLGGTFHKGGIIRGPTDEMLIMARNGEGVLSRTGMATLGGPDELNRLNRGIPRQGGNIMGRVQIGTSRMEPIRSSSSSSSATTTQNNEFNANISLDTRLLEGKQSAEELAREIDKALARLVRDDNSRTQRALRDKRDGKR